MKEIIHSGALLYSILLSLCMGTEGKKMESCHDVNNRCMARVGCGMAWQNFILGCDDLLFGETNECTEQCTRALISLLSINGQTGLGFTGCDCKDDTDCKFKRDRVAICSEPVLRLVQALNDSTVVECHMAWYLCEADTNCQTALVYFMDHCSSLMKGEKCTERCNNSLTILYRQPKAAKLINCSCEGVDECTRMRINTDRLCFHKDVSYKLQSSSSVPSMFLLTKMKDLALWACVSLHCVLFSVCFVSY